MGGNIGPTRRGSFALALLKKGNEVANLDDSSLLGKRIKRPLLSRGNTGSSLAKDLGVLVSAFPHLKPTATTCLERVEGEHVRLGGPCAFAASSMLRDAWLRGAAFETRPPVAGFMPRLRGTAL